MKTLHKLPLSILTHLEAGQLIKRNLDDFSKANISLKTDTFIGSYIEKLTNNSVQMDLAQVQISKQQETDELELLDKRRDTSFRALNMQLKVYENSSNTTESAAYKTLKIPFDAYKGIEKLNYEAENNAIDNFIIELSKPAYSSAIKMLNLSELINRLNEDNTAFKNLFSTRSTAMAGTKHYDTKAIRKTMVSNYKAYIGYVLSLANATAGLPTHEYYMSVLDIINTNRKYFSDLVARRSGSDSNVKNVSPNI